jgi:hypothetical protein
MASINAALSNVAVAKESLNLNQQKFENQKAQQSKLTGPEMTLKTETEDQLGQTEQGISMLKRALELNPNTFDNSLIDSIQYKTLAAAGSKDPKVTNTGELLNLLAKGAISQLKSTFPGAISNEERKALLALQGAEAKNKDERAVIMKAALKALQAVENRSRKRLQQINQGKYRETQPSEGTE